jgi:hypothetical protein
LINKGAMVCSSIDFIRTCCEICTAPAFNFDIKITLSILSVNKFSTDLHWPVPFSLSLSRRPNAIKQ